MSDDEFGVRLKSYLTNFFDNKSNSLDYSNKFMPKRVEIVTIDLSTARTAGSELKIAVPFKSVHVERVYSTSSPTTDKSGTAEILFDYANTMNILNSKLLQANDAFSMDQSVATAFIVNDAQPDTTMQIAFMVDIDYKAGSTKTSITGGVSVVNTLATAAYTKENAPTLTTAAVQTGTGSSTVYTCPASKTAIVTCSSSVAAAADYVRAKLNGTIYHYHQGSGAGTMVTKIKIKAGDVITADSNQSNSASAGFMIEEYSI